MWSYECRVRELNLKKIGKLTEYYAECLTPGGAIGNSEKILRRKKEKDLYKHRFREVELAEVSDTSISSKFCKLFIPTAEMFGPFKYLSNGIKNGSELCLWQSF